MSFLTAEAKAQTVVVTDGSLVVDLVDCRAITGPVPWYPVLLQGKPEHRNNRRLIGSGQGIHWAELDEDIAVQNLLMREGSRESQALFEGRLGKYSGG